MFVVNMEMRFLIQNCSDPAGTQQNFIREGAFRYPTPYPFKDHFCQRGYPIYIPSIDKIVPLSQT